MSFEQPAYSRNFSHSGGEPPTPTRTPTSPSFFSNSYQTPKQESKFHDPLSPWTPALGFSPFFNSQAHASYVPSGNDVSLLASSQGPRTSQGVDTDLASHAQHSSSNLNVSLAPVDLSMQLTSSPQLRTSFDAQPSDRTSGHEITQSKTSFDKSASESMNSAGSIRTPPPTSTSASRRKVSESQATRSRAIAPKGERVSSTLDGNVDNAATTQQQLEESPSTHFPSLEFSPDGFGFPISTGPATAPVYPQNKLFWDPEQNVDTMNLDFSMDDTFTTFGLGLQKQLEPYVSDHNQSTGMPFPSTPAFTVPRTSHVNIANSAAPALSVALNQTNTSPSTAIMTQGSSRGKFAGTAVNPSLLFTSPTEGSLPTSQSSQDDTLKPYAHQLQDAVYEKELRSRRPKRKRGTELDSPAVKAATQALRGAEDESSIDSTDCTVISSFSGPGRSISRHSRNASGHQRTASRGHDSRHISTGPGRKASVTLTIDENGRAKTETKLVDGRSKSMSHTMDVDSDTFDSDSSSSPSSQEMVFSQRSSFAFPVGKQEKSKIPKSQRAPDRRIAHSHQSSYASTTGSVGAANVNTRGIQRQSSLRRASQPQVHFEDTTSFVSGTLAGDDSEAETIVDTDEDKGNAASALRKVVRQRSNQKLRKSSMPRQTFADHRMPPSALFQPYYNQNTTTPGRIGHYTQQQDTSPTTITDPDLTTPSSGGRSVHNITSVTRCVCNIKDGDGQLMLQCDSCKHWLHLRCVGLNQHNVPEIYLCIFCNHETPKNRGARREPAKTNFPPPGSPLAYKSSLYR